MSYAVKLQNRLSENLNKIESQNAVADGSKEVKGIIDEFIEQLLRLVLDLLSGCLKKNDEGTVTNNVIVGGILQRWVVARAVRRSDISKDRRKVAERTILATLDQTTDPAEVQGLLKEINQVSVDWSLF